MQELAKAQGASNMVGEVGRRENVQSIVQRQVDDHSRELAGWSWLAVAMEVSKPSEVEEAALWSILSRARRERY